MLKELTTKNFINEVSNGQSIVLYSQTSCMPCKVVEAQLERVQEETGKNIFKVNLTNTPELNDTNIVGDLVQSTPSLFVFEDGECIEDYRNQGLLMEFVYSLS